MADLGAFAGVGGFLQGLNSVLGPHLEHKQRIQAVEALQKKQQEVAAIRRRAEKNPDLLKNPKFVAVYRDALGIGEGKSKPEDITEFLTAPSVTEQAGSALQADLISGGAVPLLNSAGGVSAPTGPAVTASGAPAPAPIQIQQAPVPSAPAAPTALAPVAAPASETAGQKLKRRIQETAAEPQGSAIIGMAFGSKIGTLSLGEKKLALQAQKQGQSKTIFRTFDDGDRKKSFAIQIDPNGDFHANQIFDAPRKLPGLTTNKFIATSQNLALIGEGVSKEDIQAGNISPKVAKRVGKLLKARKESIRDRFIAEYTARKQGQPPGSGDPKLAAFSLSDIKKGAVGAVSFVQSLMDDENADALLGAAAPSAVAPGTTQPFIEPGYPGAGPAGPPITIQTIRKK
jgi:hypothetical protein